jgi:hypothetical protein
VFNLQASSPNYTTLVISWERPTNPNGDIIGYFIGIIDLGDGSTVRWEGTVSSSIVELNLGMHIQVLCWMYYVLHIHVSESAPGVPYNVSIAAENGAGLGEFSALVYFTQELGMVLSRIFDWGEAPPPPPPPPTSMVNSAFKLL